MDVANANAALAIVSQDGEAKLATAKKPTRLVHRLDLQRRFAVGEAIAFAEVVTAERKMGFDIPDSIARSVR